jgi:hypothetical protein
MVLDGQLDSTYAHSFIVTDIPASEKTTVQLEHYHRHRAQIEEGFKDTKLAQPLRHLPSGDLNANRLWLTCCLLALNITAMVCDISPAADASGSAPNNTPMRRHSKALRRILFCVPARVTRNARQTIVPPPGFVTCTPFRRPTPPPTRSAPHNTAPNAVVDHYACSAARLADPKRDLEHTDTGQRSSPNQLSRRP